MTLAIFDLDNTLIAGDSDYSWGEFMIHKGIVERASYQAANDRFYEEYKNGTLDIYAYQRFVLEPLTRLEANERRDLHREFMADWIEPLMLDKARALLDSHRDQGHTLLIITATNSFITHPIAERLGVANILATEPELVDGNFTGSITGVPCFQEGKVQRLHDWLRSHSFDLTESFFYSDSINDLPLLEHVGKPVVVDPDERLHAVAITRQWPVISLRD
ncbi:histidinol-phosphatase [Marinimicrobium alkaliphilum]|uniref:histidinol-phosphatase n=1 Tax=Marinimicrobium alkaliphilum TaxID=2202654 RepID=UPI000DB96CD2|nr:HAD family hydrolase [Marinimicrobium alkaliphilum]